jgi:hypothetical protein
LFLLYLSINVPGCWKLPDNAKFPDIVTFDESNVTDGLETVIEPDAETLIFSVVLIFALPVTVISTEPVCGMLIDN